MRKITLESVIVQAENIISSSIDDDMLLMNDQQESFFALNIVSRAIWEMLVDAQRIEDICSALQQHFDVDEATCQEDVLECANQLAKLGLIKVLPK